MKKNKKNIFLNKAVLLFFGFFFMFPGVFAQQEITTVVKTYDEYLQNAKNQCDGNHTPWAQNNSLVTIPQYPKLDSSAVNAQISSPNLENLSNEERNKLKSELDMNRIGEFTGFKTLEVARLQYRSTMNSVFSCAILESRLQILHDLMNDSHLASNKNSEIIMQLEKEGRRLQDQKTQLKCQTAGTQKTTFMQEVVNSATRQYCHYRHYLAYLDENLQNDYALVESVEKNVGTGSGTVIPGTTDSWISAYNKYLTALEKEITRADTTLPRALKAYKDMERAYPVHLLLTIIYDDYIRLRKNLATYMNASTQLYMKAFNAQDANQR